jgi:cobalamin synthase
MTKKDSGTDPKESAFHGNALNVTAFLGGTVFAVLILIVEVKSTFQYSDILISITAMVSVLFIIATVGMIHVASDKQKYQGSTFAKTIEKLANAGFIGLMFVLPFLVFQLTIVGGIAVSVLEAIVIGIFVKALLKSK